MGKKALLWGGVQRRRGVLSLDSCSSYNLEINRREPFSPWRKKSKNLILSEEKGGEVDEAKERPQTH